MQPTQRFERLAKEHYENFTVGSRFLPRRHRKAFWTVYAYCRIVDDLGDEAEGDRNALLDAWEAELVRCFDGKPATPLMARLHETIRRYAMPPEPFFRLIEANRRDQRKSRYQTFEELLEYCAYSANPVGRMVLRILDADGQEEVAYSDATCTALQLTNFWQDVVPDFERGRVYLPLELMEAYGYSLAELERRICNDAFQSLMADLVGRTRRLFDEGDALLPRLPRRFRAEVALFSGGGRLVLDRIADARYDVFTRRPVVTRRDKARLLFASLIRHGLAGGPRKGAGSR